MNPDWSNYFSAETLEKILRIAIILVVGIIIIYILGLILRKILPSKLSQQRKMIISRFVRYSAIVILFTVIIAELKIDMTAVFGTAGVIGIVVGVASQTSIGNIVSGFFMVSEKPFEIGDQIRIGDKTGIVHSIDLLSIKIRTFDNLLLRIPNQTVISTEVINVTRFAIRRLDFEIGVAYKENLEVVKQTLQEIAKRNPLCLDEPEPLIVFKAFGASSINILFGVWFERDNYLKVKNSVFMEIKTAFEQKGIEIPFPHISVYTGEVTKPFPVEIKEKA